MRCHVQVLSPGFTSPNGQAFLFPLLVWRRALARRGFEISVVNNVDGVTDADIVIVDSKFHRDHWQNRVDEIFYDFDRLREKADKLIYYDTTDSSGWLQTELLPIVDRYWKSQLLSDFEGYRHPLYGHRSFTDYYYRKNGVTDTIPVWSVPVTDSSLLEKLDVAWNSGLADYSYWGAYRMAAYLRLPIDRILRFPVKAYREPAKPRCQDFSGRFGSNYSRATVAWQRQSIKSKLCNRIPMDRLTRRSYFSELRQSRIVLSPFGFGEICYRDYETFIAGGLLLKPDMSHLDTWPNFFRRGETYIAHSWSLDDLDSVIEEVSKSYKDLIEVAETGQELYWQHTAGPRASEIFCNHFEKLITKTKSIL